ncbi:thioesterase II family protein [Micromonospora sp. LOL_025]|uniref:thioesterase II family protein n=1 Tax=Micromonospora sp. LOL_025 TaxID=3345413 RepID=UPI003A8AFEC0
MNTDRRWFPGSPAATEGMQLFCLPHGGAGASAYRSWRGRLAGTADVVPVQPPGREGRSAEPAEWSMTAMTEQFLEPLQRRVGDRPYAIFGHSMGALLGYEATVAMAAAGRPPELLVVSGASAPQLPMIKERPVHKMPEDELVGHLRELAGTPDSVLRNADLLEMLVPTVRADFAACETYVHRPHPLLDVPLLVLGGEQDAGVPVATLDPWGERTTAGCAVHTFPGGHFYHFDRTDQVLSLIAGALTGSARGAIR